MPNPRRVIFFAAVIVGLGLFAALAYRYWYQPTYDFYNTDSGQVTGSLVQVAAPASGQVDDVYFDVGATVNKGDVLATIKVTGASAGAVSAAPEVTRVLARVTSPITGTVAVRSVSVGDTVGAGQPIATIVDLSKLWVVVDVDESRVGDIRIGQTADVSVASGSEIFRGTVADIGSATVDMTTPSSGLGLTSSDTTQQVPVKVVFDYAGYRLVPGMSASVTIYTRGAP